MSIPNKFLPTTVFNVKINNELVIDSLKIANFTQEGPEKTARGGINNSIIARHGKTTRLEMEDAIVTVGILEDFFGVTKNSNTIKITDKFPGEIEIVGTTFVIDPETGDKKEATFTVPRFIPDGLLNLTMEAEGDFGVIEIGGEVIAGDCGDFYTITFGGNYNNCP